MRRAHISIGIAFILFLAISFTVCSCKSSRLEIIVSMDEEQIHYSEQDGTPFIDSSDLIYLPLKKTVEFAGYEFRWSEAKKTATIETPGTTIKIPIEEQYIFVNYEKKEMPIEVLVEEGIIYIKAQAIEEIFGMTVEWDEEKRSAAISNPKDAGYESEDYMNIIVRCPALALVQTVPLYLYSDDYMNVFLGLINCDPQHPDSILNEYGIHGSAYSYCSIWSDGLYGNEYSIYSAFCGSTIFPPRIVDTYGNTVGRVTANEYFIDGIHPDVLKHYLEDSSL